MSYILEALKMSEQARREAAAPSPPSLLPPAGADEKEPDRAWARYLLIAALLLINVAAIALWQHPPDTGTAPVPRAASAAPPAPTAAAPKPLAQAAVPPRESPAPRVEPAAPVAEPPAAAASPQPPVIVARVEPRPAAPKARKAPAPPTPARSETAAAPPAKTEATPDPQANDDLPANIEKQLPALALSGFIQDRDQNNIVIVNDKLMREGDEVAPGLKLEKILPDGVVFNYKGYRFKR